MNKKLISIAAIVIVVIAGGLFFANYASTQVEELAKTKLAKAGFVLKDVNYNFFTQTLTLKNVEYPHEKNHFKVINTADEVIVSGISKDNFFADENDLPFVCDSIAVKNNKTVFYAYDNEELEATVESFVLEDPQANIKKIKTLYKTKPFSKEYFQSILDIKYKNLSADNIHMHAFKGSTSQATFHIKNFTSALQDDNKLYAKYDSISTETSPLNVKVGQMEIRDLQLPSAEFLEKFTALALRINELESTGAIENNESAIAEYETLSGDIDGLITNFKELPFSNFSIDNVEFDINEVPRLASNPILLKKINLAYDNNQDTQKIVFTIQDLALANEPFQGFVTPGAYKLLQEKLPQGIIFSGENTRTFNKKTQEFSDETDISVQDLAKLGMNVSGTCPSLLGTTPSFSFDDFLYGNLEPYMEVYKDIKVASFGFKFDGNKLLDLIYEFGTLETGIPKEQLKQIAIQNLKEFQSTDPSILLGTDDAADSEKMIADINNIAQALLKTLEQTGIFGMDITFNPQISVYDLLFSDDIPDHTLKVSAE